MPGSTKKITETKEKGARAYNRVFEEILNLGLGYKHILGFGFATLIASWILVVVIDIYNFLGLRDHFYHGLVPTFWHFTFRESGPIELIQWIFLGSLAVTSFFLFLKTRKNSKQIGRFWGLFTITGILMLAEDWLDIRHIILRELMTLDWVLLNVLETSYFLILGILPIGALALYGRKIRSRNKATFYLMALGLGVYLVAIFLSGPADLTNVNAKIGNSFYEVTGSLGGDDLRELHELGDKRINQLEEDLDTEMMDVRYRFKDLLVEETIELIGATLLLAAAFRFTESVKTEVKVENL